MLNENNENNIVFDFDHRGRLLTNSLMAVLALVSVLASTTFKGARLHSFALGCKKLLSLSVEFFASLSLLWLACRVLP